MTEAVGFALVQFVWQGAVIGAFTTLALTALHRTSADIRYITACVSLALMTAAPIVTAVQRVGEGSGSLAVDVAPAAPSSDAARAAALPGPLTPIPPIDMQPLSFSAAWLEPWLPFVVLAWSAGVLVLALPLLYGWRRIHEIRRTATPIIAADCSDMVSQLSERFGIVRPVQLAATALSDVPAVIGWLRPMIIVPVSVLAGLPPAHLHAILAHELAHIRRWDYLVNVGQSIVETLLFYHPAVWWVSRQIRIEREHCCDDLAASVCRNRAAYAQALASLEELRAAPPRLAMAASGGHLLNRIRRQLQPGLSSGPKLSGGVAMGVVFTILISIAGSYVSSLAAAPDRTTATVVHVSDERRDVPAVPEIAQPRAAEPPASSAAHRAASPPAARQAGAPGIVAVGGIHGRVMDQDGGVLPGVTVTATSPAFAAQSASVQTSGGGEFTFANLPSGTYDVTATLPGFRRSTTPVQVTPNADARPNIWLDIGAMQETVTVTASRVAADAAPPAPLQLDAYPTTPDAAFNAARLFYEREQFQEAEMMTTHAIDLLRAASPAPATAAARSGQRVLTWEPNPRPVPVRVGGVIRAPQKVRELSPIYPTSALVAGVERVVIIEATIAADGTVKDAHILRGDPLLDDAALGAVRQWRYTPAALNGRPTDVGITMTVAFEIP